MLHTTPAVRFYLTELLLSCVHLPHVVKKLHVSTIGRLPDRNSGRNRVNENSVDILWINRLELG